MVENQYVTKFESLIEEEGDSNVYYPLSIEQESLWIEESIRHEEEDSLVEAIGFRIKGKANFEFMQQVFSSLLRKYPILKSTFELKNNITVEVTDEEKTNANEYGVFYDLSEKTEEEIYEIETNSYKKLVSITKKISNFVLLKYKDDEYKVILCVHHLITDSSSLNKIVDEMFLLIEATYNNTNFFNIGNTNRDVKKVLDRRKKQVNKSVERVYWKEMFKEDIPFIQLPQDYFPVKSDSNHSKMITSSIRNEKYVELKLFCDKNNMTSFSVLNSIYALLIHKLSQSDIIPISVGMSTRDSNTKNEIGYFVNSLPCIYKINREETVFELLKNISIINKTVSNFRNYPFSEVNKLFEYDRSQKFHPLLQFGSTATKYVSFSKKFGNNEYIYEHFRTDSQGDSNLSIFFVDNSESFHVELIYNSSLYTEATAKKMLEKYFRLFDQVIQNSKLLVKDLILLSKAEIDEQLVIFNQTEFKYQNTKTIHQLFEEEVKRSAGNIAVADKFFSLTYKELNEKSNQLAHYLMSKGIKTDDFVAICTERSLEMLICLLGTLKAGGAYVPIDPSHPNERIKYTLEDSNPKVILTEESLGGKVTFNDSAKVYIDLLDLNTYSKKNPNNNTKSNDLAYVIYTSGTTGKPKGAMIEHKSVVNHIQWMQEMFPLDTNDKVMQKTPFGFDVSVWEFFAPILCGVQLYIVSKDGHKDVEYLVETIAKKNITVMQVVPSVLSIFCSVEDFKKCFSLKYIFCGGEAMSISLIESIKKILPLTKLYNFYGPTEACIDSSYFDCSDYKLSCAPPIGQPIGNTLLYILDENNKLVSKGMSGELHVSGEGLARGYLNQPVLTEEKFVKNPFLINKKMYKTGDLVRYLENGSIEYLGRIDNQIKIRGFRIEPEEIEQQLSNYDAIKECAVVVKQRNEGKTLVAFIVVHDKLRTTTSKVRANLEKFLPEHMIPKTIIIIDSMPLTHNGKINRNTLLKSDIQLETFKEYTAPADKLGKKIGMIFSEVLGVEKVGIHDSFFELGGHSLLAITLISKINKALKTSLPLSTIFQAPNISKLKNIIEEGQNKCDILVPIQTKGQENTIYGVPGIGGTGLEFELLSRTLGESQPFYGLQSVGMDGKTGLLSSVEAIAEANIKAIKQFQPQGPYRIIGFSFGGLVAFEMARILGKELDGIIMLDTLPDGKKKLWGLFLIYIKKINIVFLLKHYLDILQKKRIERSLVMKKVINNNYICEEKYKIRPLIKPSNIALVCAEEERHNTNIELAWHNLNVNNLHIYKFKGGHMDMLKDKGVNNLSDVVKEYFSFRR